MAFCPRKSGKAALWSLVVSHRLWQRLGSDPDLVGEFVNVNGHRCQVVGVAPEGFFGVDIGRSGSLVVAGELPGGHVRGRTETIPSVLDVVGRLKPGVTMPVAQAQLQPLVPRFRTGESQTMERTCFG